jgi:hypothetical protein
MLKLSKEGKKVVMAKDLKPGQLAIIIEDYADYQGRIIQKYGNSIIAIGLPTGCSWSGGADTVSLEVRILEEGETLTVTNNE